MMTDDERIANAKPGNTVMICGVEHTTFHGPIERARCTKHPRMTVTYRWSWVIPSNNVGELAGHQKAIEDSDSDFVRKCSKCIEELDASDDY